MLIKYDEKFSSDYLSYNKRLNTSSKDEEFSRSCTIESKYQAKFNISDNNFKMISIINAGHWGTVAKFFHIHQKQFYAIKRINLEGNESNEKIIYCLIF